MSLASTPSARLEFLRAKDVRRRIGLVCLALAVVGGLYGILGPKWYRTDVVLVPGKAQKSGGLASLLGGEMAGLASTFDTALGGSTDAVRIAAVLKSNAVADAVIEKFGLRQRYDVKYQEEAREALWKHCTVRTLTKPNLVELSCEDRDPVFLQAMLQHLSEVGNVSFRKVNVSSASEEVRFLERRVADLRQQADVTAVRMREFQERHQIVDLDSQARAVVSSLALVHGQRISRQMELDYAQRFAAPDEAGSRQMRSQIAVMEDMLRELEEPRSPVPAGDPGKRKGRGAGMFPPALAVPELRAEFEKVYRDRKVAEATLLFALERLENAKAAEARDVSTFQVLDPPTVATRKSRPRGLHMAVLGALLGLACAVPYEWWRSRLAASRGEAPATPGT
jgi:capsule polysaccharide export protein KpsE/RkpR